ncbi:MAG: hypothetical protein HYZ28_18155 [Myxococcales bacterium]|nr:hypothetical protein [Myxococcales bacterium]
MKRILFAAALLAGGAALAFSPELRNEDSKSYEYELECGGSTTHSSIGSNTTTSLGLSSVGCKLKVKGAGSAKLAEDMKCRIKDSMLECD